MTSMKPSHIKEMLKRTIPEGITIMLTGPPGCGKTSVVQQAAKDCGYDVVVTYAALKDVTDAGGIPWPDANTNSVRYLPAPEVVELCNSTKPTVWFLDDFGQAPAAVQASYMQWLLAREVHGMKLPDHVTIIIATNRRQDKANVQGILEPVKGRIHSIIEMEYDLTDHCRYMDATDHDIRCQGFIRLRSELLTQQPTQAAHEIVKAPSPRGVEQLSDIEKLKIPEDIIRRKMIAGCMGEGFATEYFAYCQSINGMIDADEVILDPLHAPMPKGPDQCYAMSCALISRASEGTFDSIGTYCKRMHENNLGEFTVLIMKECIHKKPELKAMKTWKNAVEGYLHDLLCVY